MYLACSNIYIGTGLVWLQWSAPTAIGFVENNIDPNTIPSLENIYLGPSYENFNPKDLDKIPMFKKCFKFSGTIEAMTSKKIRSIYSKPIINVPFNNVFINRFSGRVGFDDTNLEFLLNFFCR